MKKIPTGINSKSKMELYEIDEFKHFYHEDALILGIFRCDLKYLSALKFSEFRKITLSHDPENKLLNSCAVIDKFDYIVYNIGNKS